MIIDNKQFHCSLNDTSNLRNLILENPDLPLIIFCGEESWDGNLSYTQADASKGEIQTLTLYEDVWVDEDDYREKLADDLCNEEEYKDLSDEEYYQMIDHKVAETPFCKAIVIYIG